MTLTILADNTPNPVEPNLVAEHGFALHAALDDYSLLYDFGPAGALTHNSKILGIDLSEVSIAVLSHGHYDHSGGLDDFLDVNPIAKVRHGRGAFQPRWSISNGPAKDIGVHLTDMDRVVDRFSAVDSLVDNKEFVILPAAPGHRWKPAGNATLLAGSAGDRLQDDFIDELTVVLRAHNGLVVLTGCSHRGILNIVDQVKAYCPNCPILALVGGFHLFDDMETQEGLDRVVSELSAELPETQVLAGHCTESKATAALSDAFGSRFTHLHSGFITTF